MPGRRGGKGVYVNYGQPLALDAVIPGVQVHVIGPPTVAQHKAVVREPATNPEYWKLYQKLAAAGAFDPAAENKTAAEEEVDGPARWIIERLQGPQARSLLRIVAALDHAMNNTSVILLIQAGDRRLLFCGDAQIENWEYALTFAGDRRRPSTCSARSISTRSATTDPATPHPGPCSTSGQSREHATGR